MSVNIRKILFLMFLVSLLISGCSDKKAENESTSLKQINVMATLFPQYDFARYIGGEYANVSLLLPPGTESHSYDLRPSDMIAIKNSDMFVYTGKYMEVWAETIIESLDGSVMVVDCSNGIDLVKEEHNHHDHDDDDDEADADEHHHEYDPHIWTSPVYAMQMVKNICEAFCEVDPEHEDYYRRNADEYIDELTKLDAAFRDVVAQAENDTIYFGGRFAMTYFVREYGLSYFSAYPDCSAESEPSIADVIYMIDEVREHDAAAVFYEELADPKVARTISEETGAKLLLLHSAHNVGKSDFDSGITYLDIMWNNVEALKEGLR